MVELLERARRIVRTVGTTAERHCARDVLSTLAEMIRAGVVLVDAEGQIRAAAGRGVGDRLAVGTHIPADARRQFAAPQAPRQGLSEGPVASLFSPGGKVSAVPLRAFGRRVGTLLIVRDAPPDDRDRVLIEYTGALLALDLASGGDGDRDGASTERLRAALRVLSYLEVEAVWYVLAELEGDEGIVVASRVADRVGITRSVIVNALRKLEGGQVLRTRSLGMKGTHIQVLHPSLRGELERLRSRC
ncbi:MAG: hypothetical protein QN163_09055 [Armatimonadota bacterium]|nr:hypothetical protein [Armatimonadota bacterium]MDR5697750.1 hypothetical protein [Armatimonadota bacterium]